MSPDDLRTAFLYLVIALGAAGLAFVVLTLWFAHLDRKFEATIKQIKSERPHG